MGEKGEGSGVVGGGKWGRRGREVGGKGEGTGNGVPPCPPPQYGFKYAGSYFLPSVVKKQSSK